MKALFALILFVAFRRNDSFPVHQCKGTHYDCFKQVGSKFKDMINTVFEDYPPFKKVLLPWYKVNLQLYKEYETLIFNNYPEIYDEVRGLADGSGHEFHHLMLLNLENEIQGYLNQYTPPPQCTDVHANQEGKPDFIGHNEDGDELYKNNSYIVDIQIDNTRFVAFCYAGIIPGLAFGWNSHGFTFSMNALTPAAVKVGAPKFVVNRDVMRAKSYEEAIERTVFANRARGHSVNIGSYHDKRKILIELSPYDSAVHEVVGNFSHMNNYRILNIPFIEDTSSTHRLARINQMPAPTTRQDVLNCLGDSEDQEWPVYRKYTMASALYDFSNRKVYIWDTNPKDTEPKMTFDMELPLL